MFGPDIFHEDTKNTPPPTAEIEQPCLCAERPARIAAIGLDLTKKHEGFVKRHFARMTVNLTLKRRVRKSRHPDALDLGQLKRGDKYLQPRFVAAMPEFLV